MVGEWFSYGDVVHYLNLAGHAGVLLLLPEHVYLSAFVWGLSVSEQGVIEYVLLVWVFVVIHGGKGVRALYTDYTGVVDFRGDA